MFETHIQTGEIRRVVVQCGVIVVDESVGDILGRHVRLVQRTLKKVKVGAIEANDGQIDFNSWCSSILGKGLF